MIKYLLTLFLILPCSLSAMEEAPRLSMRIYIFNNANDCFFLTSDKRSLAGGAEICTEDASILPQGGPSIRLYRGTFGQIAVNSRLMKQYFKIMFHWDETTNKLKLHLIKPCRDTESLTISAPHGSNGVLAFVLAGKKLRDSKIMMLSKLRSTLARPDIPPRPISNP